MALRPDEEVDDGYTRESWERAEEDQPSDEEIDAEERHEADKENEDPMFYEDWRAAMGFYGLDESCAYTDEQIAKYVKQYRADVNKILELDDIRENAKAYNDALNRLEIAPNGDDYNELLAIIAGADFDMPKPEGR